MNFFKKLFQGTAKPKSETITVNLLGKDFIVDISAEAREEYAANHAQQLRDIWKGSNEVEMVRPDGYTVYKSNRVTSVEREAIGFYGLKWYSDNGKYCVVYLSQSDETYNVGLVDVANKQIIYRIRLKRPHRCRVTKNGVVICEDWGGHDTLATKIYILGNTGLIINEKRHNAALGDIFESIDNETKFRYNINSSGKIYTIDL